MPGSVEPGIMLLQQPPKSKACLHSDIFLIIPLPSFNNLAIYISSLCE
jgi:hypothetical protein